jgi:hypothetical protein
MACQQIEGKSYLDDMTVFVLTEPSYPGKPRLSNIILNETVRGMYLVIDYLTSLQISNSTTALQFQPRATRHTLEQFITVIQYS